MAKKTGEPGAAGGRGDHELSDVLAQPGADLPLPTDPVRTAHGTVQPTDEEQEWERAHQPPAPGTAGTFREEGEAAERSASGNRELEAPGKPSEGPGYDS
ncbi:hypothetical protein [Anaeromyxobacter paludicola]|uniref:Uncharacterized protein n=1 Tax=Anaeromyxobacter paludicola TaxID=2918171 RepID=A0ABM7XEG3_9BACT|nr:hypothetical protein [Anaeromyxobacter paludicola]BDG10246.1 hypothetical protein AMPC_33590 [Anaeromyxobacter paludicola]